MYCSIGSVGILGGMYDVHIIMSPIDVGVLMASVLSSVVGICVYVICDLTNIATPECCPKDLEILLKPFNLILLLYTMPVSLINRISQLILCNSHCKRYLLFFQLRILTWATQSPMV